LAVTKDAQDRAGDAPHRACMSNTKIVLITGANKGIGFETARRLVELGMTVLVGARDRERGAQAVARLRERSRAAHLVTLDLTDEASIATAVADVGARFGRLDVLVNNAGIGNASAVPSAQSLPAMRTLFETNVFGAIAVTQAFLPLLERAPAARIVNVSSSLGSLHLAADPTSRIAAWSSLFGYSASKAALNAFTVRLAHELRPKHIAVNSACPGYVATDLNRHQGLRTVEQGASIIVRLATLPDGGPTGGFFDDDGEVAW
jgi:NAD(P)-dependent dehydrogenase (short-subunit alcohol dehydrogenase family)